MSGKFILKCPVNEAKSTFKMKRLVISLFSVGPQSPSHLIYEFLLVSKWPLVLPLKSETQKTLLNLLLHTQGKKKNSKFSDGCFVPITLLAHCYICQHRRMAIDYYILAISSSRLHLRQPIVLLFSQIIGFMLNLLWVLCDLYNCSVSVPESDMDKAGENYFHFTWDTHRRYRNELYKMTQGLCVEHSAWIQPVQKWSILTTYTKLFSAP